MRGLRLIGVLVLLTICLSGCAGNALTDEALSISGNSVQSAESEVKNWAKGFEN